MADPETTEKSRPIDDDESDEDASEAQAQVIASLRAQVTDLFSQVTQLNGKLVASYDRMSDLEDQLHDASSSLRNASVTISSLELERSHHLAALNTGLLVEKAHVTAELNRLMERATEEAAQRGQAESARHDIEKDLDDLSATLFDQANTMVAEARLGQARSERKVQDAEQALKIAEVAVKDMQAQMQSLQAAKEVAEHDAREAKVVMGKGKWVERDDAHVGDVPRIRFMTTHTPYFEFVAFVTHLRGLRTSQPTPPVISTLTSQPFIARLLAEDSESTVRLDLAPSLNWLSRRSVLAAIHSGMLIVEPWTFSGLVQELYQHPPSTSSPNLSCALCGAFIARVPTASPVSRTHNTNGGSWFKYPLARGTTQNHSAGTLLAECEPPGQVYIFRLASATASTPPPSLPMAHSASISISAVGTSRSSFNTVASSRVLQTQSQNTPYPLCSSNYCLTRLRSTCSLWAFVRVGIVERIWEEEIQPSKPHVNGDALETQSGATAADQSASGMTRSSPSERPPVPPRRRKLWEMASALGERAVSWGKESGENNKEKDKEREKERENDSTRQLPTPPPSHPSVPHPHAKSLTQGDAQVPPPLPKRTVVHSETSSDTLTPESGSQGETVAAENKELNVHANGHVGPDKADASGLDSSMSVDEDITFAVPPSTPSAPTPPVSAEPSAPPTEEDPTPPPPSHGIPLPTTPTTPNSNPVSRVTSPAPRPRSRLSSPASPPPPGSRPTSPAIGRSRAASPTPGHHPPTAVSHIRGKSSASSPLAPPRPASPAAGPGAPPVPRRAAARRAVPLPPPSSPSPASAPAPESPKVDREVEKAELESRPAGNAADDPVSEGRASKSDEGESTTAETKTEDKVGGDSEATVPLLASTAEAASGPAEDVTVGEAGGAEELANGTSETVAIVPDGFVPAPPASEGQPRGSLDTTGTKHSSSTEGEGFAGDGTWEERTWKELVRLKEEMFWARIGGIRAPRGS